MQPGSSIRTKEKGINMFGKRCPHCGLKLGNYLYADNCPHCHEELKNNTRKLIAVPKKLLDEEKAWPVRWFMKLMRLVES